MSHYTVKLNFNQSCEIKIDNKLKIEQICEDNSYNEQLENELENRNLEIIEDMPIEYFPPETNGVHDLKSITYQVTYEPNDSDVLRNKLIDVHRNCTSAGLIISGSDSFKEQILKNTKEIVEKSNKDLEMRFKDEIEKLKNLIIISNSESVYPSLIREMIIALKIDAIKSEFGIDLSKKNNKYLNKDGEPNEKFNEDFKDYSNQIFEKYKDPSKSDDKKKQYYRRLFTYSLNILNNLMHPKLEGRLADLEDAVKDQINCEFDEAPFHPLVIFLNNYKRLIE